MQNKLNNYFNNYKYLYLFILELHIFANIIANIFVQHYINKIYLIFFKFTEIPNNKILFNNLKALFPSEFLPLFIPSETNIIVK